MQTKMKRQTRGSTYVDMDDVVHDRRLNNDASQFHVSTKVDVIGPLDTHVNRLHTATVACNFYAHDTHAFKVSYLANTKQSTQQLG